jgi:uncharacterized protein YciI
VPFFALICKDHAGALELRMATREAHMAYVRGRAELIRAAGPFLDAEGAMTGSLFIMQAPDRATVEAFSEADPYRLAGLFESVEIQPWRQTFGEPI